MLKKILLLVVLFSCTLYTHAKSSSRALSDQKEDNTYMEAWRYGIQLGPSFHAYEHEEKYKYLDATTTSNTRFHGGFFCEYRLAEEYGLYLNMNLLYIQKGTKIHYKEIYVDPNTGQKLIKDEIHLDYLESSVGLSRYFWGDLFVLVDLYISYMLSTKMYQTLEKGWKEVVQQVDKKNMRDDIHTMDMGIIIGLGYEFDMGLRVCLAPEFGFVRVYKNVSALNFGSNLSIGWNLAKWLNLASNRTNDRFIK
jgi:hypothetical protein